MVNEHIKALGGEPMWRTEYKLPMPAPQVAVQINLSPDMSEEQIERTLESIRRHFYPDKADE